MKPAKDAYYFPHDSNSRSDLKLTPVRMKYGMKGYGIYFAVLEILRESANYEIPIENYVINLAYDLRESQDEIKDIVENFNLFQFDSERKVLYSLSLKKRMQHMATVRLKRKMAGKVGGRNKALANATNLLEQTPSKQSSKTLAKVWQNPSSKVKESKVKESKVKKIVFKPEFEESEAFKKTFGDYLSMRREIKNPATDHAVELVIKELSKHDIKTAIAMLEQSIMNNWKGVFPVKQNESRGSPPKEDYDALIHNSLGKIAKKEMIMKVLSEIPQNLWWKVDAYLKKRYPEGGNGFVEAERELAKNKNQLNQLVVGMGK